MLSYEEPLRLACWGAESEKGWNPKLQRSHWAFVQMAYACRASLGPVGISGGIGELCGLKPLQVTQVD